MLSASVISVLWVKTKITDTYHENNNEDEADSHDNEEGDQVVFQRQAEVWQENHMPPGKQGVSCGNTNTELGHSNTL